MLNFDIKRKINTLRDILVGKVPDPKAQVEQITIALIYKFMDDMDLEGIDFGGSREFFKEEYEKYAWSKIMDTENSGQQRAYLYAEGIEKMTTNPHLPQLFRDIFRGAYIPYRDPETLNMFLKEVSDFNYDHSEDLGNAFEYLLSIMGSQGDAGQFRTPRHIIDMMIEIVDPKKTDTILDPACGTAGFLISSYKHIREKNKDKNGNSTLSADDRKRMTENFAGYDISPDMVRLSRVNMYLHKFAKPKIYEYDTLTSLDRWDESYDVILANPPFMTPKGGIIPHNRYRVNAKRSEVLFVDYIAEHLNPTGKAAIIVPEGIVFQSANAYKSLRKYLIKDNLLFAVISLPSGVFNPYSGVKTSILLFDRTVARQRDEILFVKMENDGYGLGAQRKEVRGSNIPEVLRLIKDYKEGKDVTSSSLVTIAKKSDIAKQDYILIGDRYRDSVIYTSSHPIVQIKDVCEVISGQSPESIYYNENEEGLPFYQGKTEFTNRYLGSPVKWTSNITKESIKNDIVMSVRAPVGPVNIVTEKICIGRGLAAIRCSDSIKSDFLFYLLKSKENQINGNSGSTFASINRKEIEEIEIPLPPLHIQEEIVSEIEGYQKVIDGARQVVENYKPSFRIDPSWKIVKLGDLANLTYGYTDAAKDNGSARFIRITDIDSTGLLRMDNPKYVDINAVNKQYLLKENDILVARTGATYGKTMIFKEKYDAIFASFLIKLDFDQTRIKQEFYWIFSQTANYWNQANGLVTGGGQPQFNANAIKQIVIPLPPIEDQINLIDKISKEMNIIEHNKKLIELFEQRISDKINELWTF